MANATTVTLLDNAYRFLNESLLNARKAKRDDKYWAFAILHLIQGLELLMKQVLNNEHPILIYENIDNPKASVSLTLCLERLIRIAKIEINEREEKAIKRAATMRNKIVHLEYESAPAHHQSIYVGLFEFVHYFHHRHIGTELHNFVESKLWRAEAELLAQFSEQWVIYRGRSIPNALPFDMVAGQKYTSLRKNAASKYTYIKRQTYDGSYEDDCPDCAVQVGEFHVALCDIEICPSCSGQLLMCLSNPEKCNVEYWIPKRGQGREA